MLRNWRRFVVIALLAATPAFADVSLTTDLLALRQLQILAIEPSDRAAPSEPGPLSRVTLRLTWANELADLLRERKPLDPFSPVTWPAIAPELCRAAGLDERRCLSLQCLLPQLNPVSAKQCPASSTLASPKVIEPPNSDIGANLGEWLKKVAEEASPPFKSQLQRGELPVNPDIVAAKGILHAIWPDLLDAAATTQAIKAENVQFLIQEVLAKVEERTTRAARLVAAVRAIRALPPDARKLIEPSASQLLSRSTRIEELYKNPTETVLLLAPSLRELKSDIDAGDQLLLAIGGQLAKSLKLGSLGSDDPQPNVCPKWDGKDLRELASTSMEGRRIAIALNRETRSDGEVGWELVIVVTASDPIKGWQLPKPIDGAGEFPIAADCVHSIIPLGIIISNLEERGGKLVHIASGDTLTQRAAPDRFAEGLDELLKQISADRQGIPGSVILDDPRLIFSPDLKSLTLAIKTTIPILNVTVPVQVRLVQNGNFVLKLSAKELLDYKTLVAEVRRAWSPPSELDIGPIKATNASLELANEELVQNGTWLSLTADLHLGKISLGKAKAYLIDREGAPELKLAADLTTLIRRPIESLGSAKVMRDTLKAAFPSLNEEILSEVAAVLLIEQARISDDGRGVEVKLALDLATVTGAPATPRITAEGTLTPDEPDLGLERIYKKLFENALQKVQNLQSLILARLREKLGRAVQDAASAVIADVIAGLDVAAKRALGIELSFTRSEKPGQGTLRLSWKGESVDLGAVTVLPGPPPRIDFSGGRIHEADGRRLGRKLESTAIARLKSLIGLAWKTCGEPRVTRSSAGIHLELSAEAPILGCVALPTVLFTGNELVFDSKRTEEAVKLVLLDKIKLLIPAELRDHISNPRWEIGNTKLVLDVKVRAPGTTIDLRGTVRVDLTKGSVAVEADPKGVAFEEIFKHFTGLVGSGFTVEPVRGRLALRASGNIELGVVGIHVREMELTPKRVYLPEIGIRLPTPIVIGPFTVFPIELRAKLQKPVRVGIVGDVSFVNLEKIVRIRSQISIDNPPKPKIELAGTMTVVDVLDLFEMTGEINLAEKLLKADAKTTGVLAAIMPAHHRLNINPSRAELDTSLELLFLAVKGKGEIRFTREPSIILDGKADLAGLAGLKAGLNTDLQLRRPKASIEGGLKLPPIGEVKYGAAASVQSVRLHASIIGITASLVLPSLRDLNGGLIKKLFEDLLKPSIDLKSLAQLKNVTVTLAPRIGGGDAGGPGQSAAGEGGKENTGDGGGPQITPVPPAPNEQGKSVKDPDKAYRTGTIPSEWQDGWLPAPAPMGHMFCRARWKDGSPPQWTGLIRAPEPIVQMLAAPMKPNFQIGIVPAKRAFWQDCSQEFGGFDQTEAIAFFDGTAVPKIWHQGTATIENGGWIDTALKHFGLPGAAGVTWTSMPSAAVISALQILHQFGLTGEVATAVKTIKLPDNRVYYRIASGSGSAVHLIDVTGKAGQIRSFRADEPLGRLVLQATAEPPTEQAALRATLLPLLFAGGAPLVLSDKDGRLLLEVAPFDGKPFLAAFRASPPRCGTQVDLEDTIASTPNADLFDPIASVLLAEDPSCVKSARWTKALTVVDGAGVPQRVIGLRDKGGGDWSMDFVDSKVSCLRSDLTGPKVKALVETWRKDGLPNTDVTLQALGNDNGLMAILEAIGTPEIGWRAKFHLDPFLMAVCGGAK